ncbi:MAG: ribonuclease Y [Acidobacteria bacterium]|nr:MAG: ribonuclease Y [Acidobacteriota bacterium]
MAASGVSCGGPAGRPGGGPALRADSRAGSTSRHLRTRARHRTDGAADRFRRRKHGQRTRSPELRRRTAFRIHSMRPARPGSPGGSAGGAGTAPAERPCRALSVFDVPCRSVSCPSRGSGPKAREEHGMGGLAGFAAAGATGGSALLATAALGAALGLAAGWALAARTARGVLSRARAERQRILEAAEAQAEREAAEHRARVEQELERRRRAWEEEEKRRSAQLEQAEEDAERRHRRLVDRDRALARRDQLLVQRERELETRREEVASLRAELERLREQALVRLEEVAALPREEARRQLLEALRAEVRQSAAAEVRAIKEDAQRRAEIEAQKIIALAIERVASEYSASRSVSHVKIPDPAIRGRIIGTEGRNIRTFEKLTGMQLVIDDNPGQVTISGFNPVRREIARRALEKLIEGGVIHPRRIQQVVAQVKRKVEQETLRAGREAAEEFGLKKVHPEILTLLGRLKFRTSYGQNVLEHVKECARICGMLAAELGLDQKLAERAALLHDIGKAVDFEREGTHPEIGGEIARRYGEPDVVVNAIESHHDDCEVIHPISVLVAAADALSGARPGARRQTTVDYIRRVKKLEEIGASFEGVSQCYALQAGRELRVIVEARKLDDDRTALLAHDLAQRIQNEMDYPGRVKITVIRELKAQAVAR